MKRIRECLRTCVGTSPYLGVGFMVGIAFQFPFLIAAGLKRTAVLQAAVFLCGALWAVAGFAVRRSWRKRVAYLKAEGFELPQDARETKHR